MDTGNTELTNGRVTRNSGVSMCVCMMNDCICGVAVFVSVPESVGSCRCSSRLLGYDALVCCGLHLALSCVSVVCELSVL